MIQVILEYCVLHNIVEKVIDNYYVTWTMEVNERNTCMLNLVKENYHKTQ